MRLGDLYRGRRKGVTPGASDDLPTIGILRSGFLDILLAGCPLRGYVGRDG
jgi:hypothetical protein